MEKKIKCGTCRAELTVEQADRFCSQCRMAFKPGLCKVLRCKSCKTPRGKSEPYCPKCGVADNEAGFRCPNCGYEGGSELLDGDLCCPYDHKPINRPVPPRQIFSARRVMIAGCVCVVAVTIYFIAKALNSSTGFKPNNQSIRAEVTSPTNTAPRPAEDTGSTQRPAPQGDAGSSTRDNVKPSPKPAEIRPEDRQVTPSRATSQSQAARSERESQSKPKSGTSMASATLPPKLPQDSGQHPTKITQQPEPESPPLQPPQPPVPAAVHSGVLHYQGPPVPYNGVVVFDHLPQARLKFNFDRQAWTLIIKPNPDGTKRVTMISQKQGSQMNCDLSWEIVE